MKIGTKSLIFGVHQFLWHPFTVYRAWKWLYGPPSWRETVCIFVHDWGYWGEADMDGPSGKFHPELGARIARTLFGSFEHDLVLLHSRSLSSILGQPASKLCWADKLSIAFDPAFFYLFRAWLSGELTEYRRYAQPFFSTNSSPEEWFVWLRNRFIRYALEGARDRFGPTTRFQHKTSALAE